jgi:hypothetical protein
MSNQIAAVNDRLSKYSGIQDTDVVLTTGKNGKAEWTTAGAAKLELEKQRDELQKNMNVTLENIDKNIAIMAKAVEDVKKAPVTQQPEKVNTPPANTGSPVVRAGAAVSEWRGMAR